MKTLDALLSRWVGEADDSRADAAFQAYYSTAFPSLARHVQHRTGWDPASAEDIAQEALLRFFERAGRARRAAIALVKSASMNLTSSEVVARHSRQALHWAADVTTFAGSVTGFRVSLDERWRAAADEIWSQIVSLQRKGLCLIGEVRWSLLSGADGRGAGEAGSPSALPVVAVGDIDPPHLEVREIGGFAKRVAHERSLHTAHATNTEERCPGIGGFVEDVLTVIETLPRLRLPTNGYLFEIATTLFLDEVKRRGRRKRGGVQEHASAHEVTTVGVGDVDPHAVEFVPDEPQADLEGGNWLGQQPLSKGESCAAASVRSVEVDPVVRYESEEFLHRFYEYLRAPLARAARALDDARGTTRALSEEYRLECMSRKFSRMMTVLSMMGEGYTQEETARRAGLSRNQVKYIVESVKDAYARFAADKSLRPCPRVTREGESHAP